MNDQELALVLERDYQSLNSGTVKATKRIFVNTSHYFIDITKEDEIHSFIFRVTKREDGVLVSWSFFINSDGTDGKSNASNRDGYEYLSLTRSTTLMPLKKLLQWLAKEIIDSYIIDLEKTLDIIKNALEGEQ